MDTSTIDQAYGQLQTEFQDVAKSIQALAEKLQTAAQGGDQNAKEWLLDLKQVALDVKDEQVQVNALLQAIHGFHRHLQPAAPAACTPADAPQQIQAGWAGHVRGRRRHARGGGMFGNFLGGGFGRAIEMGAGIGLGEDLINSIF